MNKVIITAKDGQVTLKLEDVATATMTPVQAFEVASELMTIAKTAKAQADQLLNAAKTAQTQTEKELKDGRTEAPPTQPPQPAS